MPNLSDLPPPTAAAPAPALPALPPALAQRCQLCPVTEADTPFLRDLYAEVRAAELAPTGWSAAQRRAFCDDQFDKQAHHYRTHYPHAHFWLLCQQGEPMGRLYVNNAPALLGLMEISLRPAARGQGLGTQITRWLMDAAEASGRPLQLYVEQDNPARRLYERLGLVAVEHAGPYLRMLWPAPEGAIKRG